MKRRKARDEREREGKEKSGGQGGGA